MQVHVVVLGGIKTPSIDGSRERAKGAFARWRQGSEILRNQRKGGQLDEEGGGGVGYLSGNIGYIYATWRAANQKEGPRAPRIRLGAPAAELGEVYFPARDDHAQRAHMLRRPCSARTLGRGGSGHAGMIPRY